VGDRKAKKADYDDVDVIPVSDPNAATMSQKIVQYQAVLQLSQTAPQIYDMPYLHRQMIETLGVKNAQKIIPVEDDMKPVDPVTENMNILTGKPVKAFLYQDHEAHIRVHMSAMQDPKIMQMVGQNPQAQQLMGAAQAHLMEHIAFEYRKQIEKQLGSTLPPPPDKDNDESYLPEAVEIQISQLAAQAAAQLLQKDMAEAQAQQVAQQQQDPIIQMQQQELQLRAQELQLKAQQMQVDAQIRMEEQKRKIQKDAVDAAARVDELELRQAEASARQQLEAAKMGVDIQKDKAKQQAEGVRLGMEIAKAKDLADIARTSASSKSKSKE